MKSRWDDNQAKNYEHDPLAMRVYTSRLLGQEPDLVLHGGGNTSVKAQATNLYGDTDEIIYIKGSGWDLATIEAAGFAPVRLDVLRRLAQLDRLTDTQMVQAHRGAMTDPSAPTPSVEAILHAIIPFRFVDHTHADAVVAITNTEGGQERIRQIYGDRVLVVPYVMPGFVLAKQVHNLTLDTDWSRLDGMVLIHHGVFTFADTARESYERMIELVSQAQDHLEQQGATVIASATPAQEDLTTLAAIRKTVSCVRGTAVVARIDQGPEAVGFSSLPDIASTATRGPVTPDHVIRTKRIPVIIGDHPQRDVDRFADRYRDDFQRHTDGTQSPLDPAPRWAVWPGHGTVALGGSVQEAAIISDIAAHTLRAIQWAEVLGGWQPLGEANLFEMEYWELEQAKLRKSRKSAPLQGKVALVTGAASGIGLACVDSLRTQGAAVTALDINPDIQTARDRPDTLTAVCDVTNHDQIQQAVDATVRAFGGLDILVSNAGTFRTGQSVAQLDHDTWQQSLDVNLSSHQAVLQACIPYLKLGVDPAVVVVGSKNVAAPGRGAAAYSVAKAGLTQLARVAALELGPEGIRVNVIHPHAVFDTGIWTPDVLQSRAGQYGLSVEQYKKNNLLGVEVSSQDVADLICALAGPLFAKVTGAQIPIDGGLERVV